jgi:hypothetical protein
MRKFATTASNEPSPNGKEPASATRNETEGWSEAARETTSSEKSTATTEAPLSMPRPVTYPGPVATTTPPAR